MTRKELMQIRSLNKEILAWKKELMELEAESIVGSPKLDGGNAAPGKFNSAVENRAVKMADKKETIKRLEEKAEAARVNILKYIETVDDSLLRQIILYRCIKGYSWQRTALEIGGTADALRMIFNRSFPIK